MINVLFLICYHVHAITEEYLSYKASTYMYAYKRVLHVSTRYIVVYLQ